MKAKELEKSDEMGYVIRRLLRWGSGRFPKLEQPLTIENPPFMKLVITPSRFNDYVTVAHIDSKGVKDPEIKFFIGNDGGLYPVEVYQPEITVAGYGTIGGQQIAAVIDDVQDVIEINSEQQKSLAKLADYWAGNLRNQGFGRKYD